MRHVAGSDNAWCPGGIWAAWRVRGVVWGDPSGAVAADALVAMLTMPAVKIIADKAAAG